MQKSNHWQFLVENQRTHGQFQFVSSVSVLTPGLKAAKSSERAPVRALVSAAFSDCLAIDWTGSVSISQFSGVHNY